MELGLDLSVLPQYVESAQKTFRLGEKHITRVFGKDVLLLIQEGELFFREAGREITLGKDEYYIQRGGLLQEGDVPSDARYYYIHFRGSFVPGGMPLRGRADVAGLSSHFRQLDFLQLSKGSAVETSAVFYTVLSELNRRAEKTENSRLVRKILAELSGNLGGDCSLERLSRLCGYSKNHVIHVFKSETGQTPYAHILQLRLEAAERLLLNSDRTVSDIAEETGFGSYVNLYKQFQKKRGCTPLEWRERHRRLREQENADAFHRR